MTDSPTRRCSVCGSSLPAQTGLGRPRKTCRDEDSPTPGGCARWRNIEKTYATLSERPSGHRQQRPTPYRYFPDGGFLIERLNPTNL